MRYGAFALLVMALVLSQTESASAARQFQMRSLEGKPEMVTVEEDQVHKRVKIRCGHHMLTAWNNWYGVTSAVLLDSNLLRLSYGVHGGSETRIDDLLLICIKGGRPVAALSACGNASFATGSIEYSYNIRLELIKKKMRQPALKISASMLSTDGKQQRQARYTAVLRFDRNKGIFYHRNVQLHRQVQLVNADCNTETRKVISGSYSSFSIGSVHYYLIGNRWCRDKYSPIYNKGQAKLYHTYSVD